MPVGKRNQILLTIGTLFLLLQSVSAQSKVTELHFEHPPASESNTFRTLQSLVKVQGTAQFCEDGLYLMTHYGNRDEIFQRENQEMINNPLIGQPWRHCSLFSSSVDNSVVMGRNWDNQNVGSIIVSLYYPPKGYSSVSFTRSIDLGFGHKDLEEYKSSPFGSRLLLAPFYAFDGINEHGLAVGVAGVKQVTVKTKSDKELVYVPFLVRKLLDHAKNIEQAVDLVDKFIPFDLDKNSLNTHCLVVDASGRSVILEYTGDQWETIHSDKGRQVLTNSTINNVSDASLRKRCWRYRSISETLDNAKGIVDWKAGIQMLRDVKQKGTTWSVVYSLNTRELNFSVYQDWDVIYRLKPL